MASVKMARRYAQAALELAIEHDELGVWQRDLARLARQWEDPQIRGYFEDMRVNKATRLERARELLGSSLGPRPLNMLLLLITRGATNLVPYIARQFVELERQREQTVVATVTSALPLTPQQEADLKARLAQQTGKEVQLQTVTDPSILGGLIIKVGDQLLDLSIAGKLTRLREQVVGRNGTNHI
jgi:F-type H+-transporting ATPase subunit delta